MRVAIAFVIAGALLPHALYGQQVESRVIVAMVPKLPDGLAVVIHKVPVVGGTASANTILLAETAGPRELAAALATYRHVRARPRDARVVIKATRNLVSKLTPEHNRWANALLAEVRGAEPKHVEDVGIARSRELVLPR